MRLSLLRLLLAFWGGLGLERVRVRGQEEFFTADTVIRDFAVATNSVYVVTEDRLHQLGLGLTPLHTLFQKGYQGPSCPKPRTVRFRRGSPPPPPPPSPEPGDWNATFSVNTFVPFPENRTLVTCGVITGGVLTGGVIPCGYCELLDLRDISRMLHWEDVEVGTASTVSRDSAQSLGFPVRVEGQTYILSTVDTQGLPPRGSLLLLNTNDAQHGRIFSSLDQGPDGEVSVCGKKRIRFVDGFQVGATIYIFSDLRSDSKVRLLWLEARGGKAQICKSLRGATLRGCGGGPGAATSLVSSSVISPGPPVLWAGVFACGDQNQTRLAVFDVSPPAAVQGYVDPDFNINQPVDKDCPKVHSEPVVLHPTWVLSEQSFMTSVLAVRLKTWVVFFIGTGDGQVIKLAMDKNFRTRCPEALYKANDDRLLFSKMYLDPVDSKHVFAAISNQLRRVPVAQCEKHLGQKHCWAAMDPYCGWCPSLKSCTFEDVCPGLWLSVPEDLSQRDVVSHVLEENQRKLNLTVWTHMRAGGTGKLSNFSCHFSSGGKELCGADLEERYPQCTCTFSSSRLPVEGLNVTVLIRVEGGKLEDEVTLVEEVKLTDCSAVTAPCGQCIAAGCGWRNNSCSWAQAGGKNALCPTHETETDILPEIFNVTPNVVSFYGKNHVLLAGRNLRLATGVRIKRDGDCSYKESPVWNNTGHNLTFHVPGGDKGAVKLCLVVPGGGCHGTASIALRSSPSCRLLTPPTTWFGGGRTIRVSGSNLEFAEGFVHNHLPQNISLPLNCSAEVLYYRTPPARHTHGMFTSEVSLRVANQTLPCQSGLRYLPNPKFTSFIVTNPGQVNIQKEADDLDIKISELEIFACQGNAKYKCILDPLKNRSGSNYITCDIQNDPNIKVHSMQITFGDVTETLIPGLSSLFLVGVLVMLLIPIIVLAVVCIYRYKQRKLTEEMNKCMEDLEMDVRNRIRQGFVDLQTEKMELMENVGAIPFLDYKHFASRIFFPEGGIVMMSCIQDLGQVEKVEQDEGCSALSGLIREKVFLTSLVHALEQQKSFTIKDKCVVASLLTVVLQRDLSFLTEVMEELLEDLMEATRSSHPKLMLRRTESIVEKLLSNWMSICLYGFLREGVGHPLFLLLGALQQQISKGPVDSVTEKALYTLNEDWLLWQEEDFNTLKLQVLFAAGADGELSEPLEVQALSCDTVDQVKAKILAAFQAKFGFYYNTSLRDTHIEFERNGAFVALEEVDETSEVLGEVTMLNTLRHYKVPDGALIKVLSRRIQAPLSSQGSVKDDQNFSVKYFHLIDPEVEVDQRRNPERKKLKLKEVHLTKLLSTKVAVHSYVENLFRAIWGAPQGRAPPPIKYFFDFLDAQAAILKISDPDVLHIWKTNSLPLRFWVNILKNPQFVFDVEKTPHLDGCLTVIAQAFMDSFSLSDMQLGKHAPTNKLLYAKDIPQFKQEVKSYYKQVHDQQPISSAQFKDFLLEESKKHENEFNESAALRELFKFVRRYLPEINQMLEQNGAPAGLKEQLQHVASLFDKLKSCSWS